MEGKQWRERNKMISQLIQTFVKQELPEALLDALPVALKEKAETRGPFALQAIEFGEQALSSQISALASKIADLPEASAVRAKSVADAEEALNALEG